jgi:hypothetical protein
MSRVRFLSLLCAALFAAAVAPGDHQTQIPTFGGEAGRILSRHCVACHRPGQPGRIPFDTWEQAKLFAREIRLVVGMRKMPPWPAVPGFGHFSNDRSLSISDIETLIRWTDTGATKGDSIGRLTPEVHTVGPGVRRVELDSPVVYNVPATGDAECRCFSVRFNSTIERWVKGIDVTPGDRRVVLHVRAFLDVDHSAERLDREDPGPGFDCLRDSAGYLTRPPLGDWAPGMALQLLPEDTARGLPAGSSVMVEVRYGRVGNPVKDESRVHLVLQEKRPARIVRTTFVKSHKIDLAADTWSIRAETAWTVDGDLTLISLIPYMTSLGTDFRAKLSFPDGMTAPLVWVHDYDPQWQILYVEQKPLLVRSGTQIVISSEFDNFETNPRSKRGVVATGQFALGLEYVSGHSD